MVNAVNVQVLQPIAQFVLQIDQVNLLVFVAKDTMKLQILKDVKLVNGNVKHVLQHLINVHYAEVID